MFNTLCIILWEIILALWLQIVQDEGLIKNLFNLKSLKFLIFYVDIEHLSAEASRTSVNELYYIILY